MHGKILRAVGSAVLLLLAWYANRIRHPERSWLRGLPFFLARVWALVGAQIRVASIGREVRRGRDWFPAAQGLH